eukprot:5126325-Alexandrium_andersonii.AAC.1
MSVCCVFARFGALRRPSPDRTSARACVCLPGEALVVDARAQTLPSKRLAALFDPHPCCFRPEAPAAPRRGARRPLCPARARQRTAQVSKGIWRQ